MEAKRRHHTQGTRFHGYDVNSALRPQLLDSASCLVAQIVSKDVLVQTVAEHVISVAGLLLLLRESISTSLPSITYSFVHPGSQGRKKSSVRRFVSTIDSYSNLYAKNPDSWTQMSDPAHPDPGSDPAPASPPHPPLPAPDPGFIPADEVRNQIQ